MANTQRQSQFRRLFSFGLSLALTGGLLLGSVAFAAEMMAPASNYQPIAGEEFFLLSETSYGSDEQASVRLEVQRDSLEIEEYGGVDVALYRVPDAIKFLRAQSNLHRVRIPVNAQAEGLSNMLRLSWDKIWANSRYAWKTIFSPDARAAATHSAPELKTPADIAAPTKLRHPAPYSALPGMTLVDRFRYPVQSARPIQSPQGVKLAGSSNEFLPSNVGNVRIGLGKQPPGLYLVEAYVGKHRALGLVFVSDSVVITKNTAGEMLAWAAQRRTGAAVAGAEVAWSDGVGVLKTGKTGRDGVVRLGARSPQTSYVYGVDAQGGVFMSENFYHDSEIYNAKLYAVTDRPLYRPGDLVQVKFLGRDFKSARHSVPVPSGPLDLTVVDPAGTQILSQKIAFDSVKGADTAFRLPSAAQAGGWELVFSKGEDRYSAALRVADFVKPHFEIDVVLDKPDFKTKEAVTGSVHLTYPDGAPVAHAMVRLTARAQALSIVEGELRYGGPFPIAIQASELKTDSQGKATFTLPAAADPSRYILSLLAQDGAAYRVRANKEILIERGATLWQLTTPVKFSRPGETVDFRFTPQGAGTPAARPSRWEVLRLEDRQLRFGSLPPQGDVAQLPFPEAGSYTVSLRDGQGNLLAATSHWVSGAGMKAMPGSVEIVFDKERYQPGESAHALITFPQPVDEALLTLERDKVERTALLSGKADWLTLTQVAPAQWKADILVGDDFSPNITFSALYVHNGDYAFQNKGLRVAMPSVDIEVKLNKARYEPGETVVLDIETRQGGQPVAAQVTLGVIDEMIYVLQPEIAPTMGEFFYHPRRNNVRTVASLSFIGYDLARLPGRGGAPVSRSPSERGVKVLERPRRDDTDTAAWWPTLNTDAQGKASVSFRMPDAITRWRMTARAITGAGTVGQSTRYVESHKDLYVKWNGPTTFRHGDQPGATLLAFNQTGVAAKVQLSVQGAGLAVERELTLQPGANSVPLMLKDPVSGDVAIALRQQGREVDSVRQRITVLAPGWMSQRSLAVDLRQADTPLNLPADAVDVKLSLAQGAAGQFARVADDLLEYPWGCVEQTSSRLLPLALAYRGLPSDAPRLRQLSQTLASQRLRLIQMAGPQAVFSWWGVGTRESSWLTAYAYYADWHVSRALGLELPADHWAQVQQAYTQYGKDDPLPLRALSVWFMREMALPVKTLVQGLVLEAGAARDVSAQVAHSRISAWLGADVGAGTTDALTLTLIGQLARQQQVPLSDALAQRIAAASEALRAADEAPGLALLAMDGRVSTEEAARSLAALGPADPTFDRALALVWWNKALGGVAAKTSTLAVPQGAWKALASPLGAPTWRWSAGDKPASIRLATAPAQPLTGFVRYRSAETEKGQLPVVIQRKLFRLVAAPVPAPAPESGQAPRPSGSGAVTFTLEPAKDSQLKANELYLEEVRLSAKGNAPRFGLLEVPLPPGADVEQGTWGIRIKDLNGDGAVLPIERARNQSGELSYAVPVDHISHDQVFHHLIRFGSRGRFVLPPARFYRMYQPQEKAFEAGGERQVEVR